MFILLCARRLSRRILTKGVFAVDSKSQNRIISIEGGWAAGKTSILREIEMHGHTVFSSVVPEIYKARGENYSPRDDAKSFTELFLRLKEEQMLAISDPNNSDTIFFDRVCFAPIVLRRFLGLPIPGEFFEVARRIQIAGPVFLVEQLPLEAHKNGWPRKHFSYQEALRYQEITEDVIRQLGFDIYKVKYSPSIELRAQDILTRLEETLKGDDRREGDETTGSQD